MAANTGKAHAPKPKVIVQKAEEDVVLGESGDTGAASVEEVVLEPAVPEPAPAEPQPKAKPKVKVKAPAPQVIAQEPEAEAAAMPVQDTAAESAQRRTLNERLAATRKRGVSALDAVAPGHPHALLFGLIGLICALLVFWIGFFQTLFIVVMIVIGVAIGQLLDGDPKIIRGIQKLIPRDDD